MARKKLGHVELEWTCPACGTRNPGSQKLCGGCGGAMPEDVQFELPEGAELDTSKETAAKVAAGPDIHCPYCGTRNPATAKHCSQCGGALDGGERRKKGRVMGAFKKGPVAEVRCPHCGAMNPGTARKCKSCGGVLAREKAKVSAARPGRTGMPTAAPPKKRSLAFGCVAVAFVVLVIVGIMVTRGCSQSGGVVQSVSWTYSIDVEGLAPATSSGWLDEIPAGAEIGQCTEKVRTIEAEPVPGAIEVCGTPYVVDTGTGQGEVVQDCEYHVMGKWCTYTVLQWTKGVREVVAEGSDFDPFWPELRLNRNEREGERSERYTVEFLSDDRNYNYHPRSLEEFRRFEIGSQWDITTNALGGVVSVTPH